MRIGTTVNIEFMKKRIYTKPTIEVITIVVENMMQTVSLEKRDDEYATGGGDAKAYTLPEDMMDNGNDWDWED